MANNSSFPLQGWIPYKLQFDQPDIECHWLDTFNAPYGEPFFDETITKLKAIPRRAAYYNSVSMLPMMEEWAADIEDPVEPTTIIFHVSRCGSTLISQLLSIDEQNIVLPEVPFLDDILRLHFKDTRIDETHTDRMLRAALRFYGQKRSGNEQHLYIKADSWHIFFYEQLRKLYPDVPFILLYRTPDEVFRSHTKQRGIHAVPGLIEPQLFGLEPKEVTQMDQDIYITKVLEHYFSAYIEIADQDKNVLLINYNEGIMPIMDKIASFTGIPFEPAHYEKMKERSNYHSKRPDKVFSEEKNITVPPFLEKAMVLYEHVETRRLTKE